MFAKRAEKALSHNRESKWRNDIENEINTQVIIVYRVSRVVVFVEKVD